MSHLDGPKMTVTMELDGTTVSFVGHPTKSLGAESLAQKAWWAWQALVKAERE